ncbi:hypothetical protein CTI12_AA528850 [Artemisia annua]|uniref:Uncharacterized protein n=1 Tax=Artemisia annua TaxID=35608 RepID=A0A2U1L585_ARTAN|nr:hypothetical protein CTI12_AA528850 [Artemisia annua]
MDFARSIDVVPEIFKMEVCEISNNKIMVKKDYDDFFEIKKGGEVVHKFIDPLDPMCVRRLELMLDIMEKAHAASIAAREAEDALESREEFAKTTRDEKLCEIKTKYGGEAVYEFIDPFNPMIQDIIEEARAASIAEDDLNWLQDILEKAAQAEAKALSTNY